MRCDQPRVLDLNARNGRMVESLPAAIMADVDRVSGGLVGRTDDDE